MTQAADPSPAESSSQAVSYASRRIASISHFRTNFFAGLFVLIPVAITVWICSFLFNFLSWMGKPLADGIVERLKESAKILAKGVPPEVSGSTAAKFFYFLAGVVDANWFRNAVGVVFVLVLIYVLGWLATNVVGRKLLSLFDRAMARIPFVQTIYGATKQLLATFQQKPDGVQRVVLIDFPTSTMKTVGLVTRTFKDAITGRELAAVYVPTTPNPTSGYLEIVPVEYIINTDWTVNDAMQFIISGGSVAPSNFWFDQSAPKRTAAPGTGS